MNAPAKYTADIQDTLMSQESPAKCQNVQEVTVQPRRCSETIICRNLQKSQDSGSAEISRCSLGSAEISRNQGERCLRSQRSQEINQKSLITTFLLVVAIHSWEFSMQIVECKGLAPAPDGSEIKLSVATAFGRHFAFLTSWAAFAVETSLIYIFWKSEVTRAKSRLMITAAVLQLCAIIGFWVSTAWLPDFATRSCSEMLRTVGMHGIIGCCFFAHFVTHEVVVYASDFITIVLVGLTYTITHVFFSRHVVEIYPGMDFTNNVSFATAALGIMYLFALICYGLIFLYCYYHKTVVFDFAVGFNRRKKCQAFGRMASLLKTD